MQSHPRRIRAGFTLVELLVVIGIIALLISILLPSLAKARKTAMAVKCLANLHSIGLAATMYSNDNRGAILPCFVWGGNGGGYSDPWAFILISNHYLPDPRIQGGSVGAANTNTVLVCPAVRDLPVFDNTCTTLFQASNSTGIEGANDGYYRIYSRVLMPNAGDAATHGYLGYTPPEPTSNSPVALGACIVDIGYGVNGCTDGNSYVSGGLSIGRFLPMQSIKVTAVSSHTMVAPPKMSQFSRSSQTVMMFDGNQWNVFNPASTSHLWRITGARHGNWSTGGTSPVTGTGHYRDYTTGITNVLFLDGHAAGISRGALPGEVDGTPYSGYSGQMLGNLTYLVNTKVNPGVTNAILWNSQQQHP